MLVGIGPGSHDHMTQRARDAIAEGIGFCSEDRKHEGAILALSVRENLILALQARQCGVCAIEGDRIHAFLLQCLLQYPADGAIVVNDPDILGAIL